MIYLTLIINCGKKEQNAFFVMKYIQIRFFFQQKF